MADAKTILILSDKTGEAANSIRRALSAFIADKYKLHCSTYDEMHQRINERKKTAVRDRVIQEFDEGAKVLQQSYARYLERTEEDAGKKEEDPVSALIVLESVINMNTARSNRFGGGIADQLRNIAPKKRQEEQEKKKIKTEHDKKAKLAAFENNIADLKSDLSAKLNDMPMDSEPALVEDLRQGIMDVFNQYLQELKSSEKALAGEAGASMQSFPSIASIQKEAISAVANEICLAMIIDLNGREGSDGIRFLRRHWAELIKYNINPAPIIFLSLHNIQELVRRDKRYFALHSEGVEVLSIPFHLSSFQDAIRWPAERPTSAESMKRHLRQSADLAAGAIIEHKWKNFAAPLSLLRGALSIDDIDINIYQTVLKELQKNDEAAYEETFIYEATDEHAETIDEAADIKTKDETLATSFIEKRVLLIDDEAEASGMKLVLETLCGAGVIDAIYPERGTRWHNTGSLLADARVNKLLSSVDELEKYDLILLDLYITDEDEKLKKLYPDRKPPEGREFGGLSLLHRMTESENFTVPVILFTATTRAFNIQEAKQGGKGIEAYIQKKACYHNKDEAISYYQEFKDLLAESTSQERTLLRYVWKCIRAYDGKSGKDAEIIKYLESAFSFLKEYLRGRHYQFLLGTLVMIGLAVQVRWKERQVQVGRTDQKNAHVYSHSMLKDKAATIPIGDIYAFIAYQLRGDAVHSTSVEKLSAYDIYFAIYALLYALGMEVETVAQKIGHSSPAAWTLTADMAKEMVESICNYACPASAKPPIPCTSKTQEYTCKGKHVDLMKRATTLFFDNNFLTAESSKNQVLFKYLFFLLNLRTNNPTHILHPLFQHLLKARFTGNCDSWPPFVQEKESGAYCWVGEKDGNKIKSALGILDPGMYKDEKAYDNGKVLFHPTDRYLRG